MSKFIKHKISAALLLISAFSLAAAPIDDAKRLFNEGDYAGAVEKLRVLKKNSPRDGNVNYYLGASLYALGEYDEAIPALKQAESRGVTDASRILAEHAIKNYQVEDADTHLDAWADKLKKSKKEIPESHALLSAKVMQLRNMLDRVEKIEIIDSLSVDSAQFFQAYRLSSAGGRVLAPYVLGSLGGLGSTRSLSAAYVPENRTELLWAAADADGVFSLYGADILDDGTVDHTQKLGDNLNEGGNAQFPFLMPDGVTLYFANDGENSLGGYDIFMTRRTEGDGGERSYFQPQNVGMPYNSPANDYMLAIDEAAGLGWWATDRNAEPGKVTVYVFIPSAMRVNASPDDPDLADLARVSSIALTQKEGVDYAALLEERLPAQQNETTQSRGSSPSIAIDNGKGEVYTSLSDFKNERARSTMLEALAAEAELRKSAERLEALRDKWRKGDRSVAEQILDMESRIDSQRSRVYNLRNTALRLESGK